VDILAPAANIALGKGWFPLEIYGEEKFRWMSASAEISVAAFANSKHYLQIYLEPGPSLDLKPFTLLVSENGSTLARATVTGRQMISVELPAGEPAIHKLVFQPETGDKPELEDPRVLNLRVFKLAFVQAVVDILPPHLDARVGAGWYRLETFNGETFRWAGGKAEIEIPDGSKAATVPLEIEPGPGVEFKPFTLRVLNDRGTQLAQTQISTRQSLTIPLDAARMAGPVVLTLLVEGGGKRIPSDPRIMNFRAFAYSLDLKTEPKKA
jgi:hypothetical protein